jgi:outer membrane protein OmpA-like peptidoglycan-associated protein
MKTPMLLLALLTASTASAEPRNMSKNPRVGLLAEIKFSEGSARMPEASGSQLGRVAAWAEEHFDGLIVLDGHADRRGTLKLSLQRARLVRDQLIGLGVDPDQIVMTAFGAEGKKHARVAIWGTHNSLEQTLALRRNAPIV